LQTIVLRERCPGQTARGDTDENRAADAVDWPGQCACAVPPRAKATTRNSDRPDEWQRSDPGECLNTVHHKCVRGATGRVHSKRPAGLRTNNEWHPVRSETDRRTH